MNTVDQIKKLPLGEKRVWLNVNCQVLQGVLDTINVNKHVLSLSSGKLP